MSVLTDDMRRVLDEQQLGFIATVCPDGTPNLSPKGTTAAWDDDHLIFADICSPKTIANLQRNPAVEINVVDVLSRKGYRFKGRATIFSEGDQFAAGVEFYRQRGSTSRQAPHRVGQGRAGARAVLAVVRPGANRSPAQREMARLLGRAVAQARA